MWVLYVLLFAYVFDLLTTLIILSTGGYETGAVYVLSGYTNFNTVFVVHTIVSAFFVIAYFNRDRFGGDSIIPWVILAGSLAWIYAGVLNSAQIIIYYFW